MIAERSRTKALILRPAAPADVPQLEALIAASARTLSRGFYSEEEVEAAIAHVFGVDSELIADGTYFVAESEAGITACGGWSRRRTLFGGDGYAHRAAGFLDPATEAARIRAFLVAPGHARRGIGTTLLSACERAACAEGFAAAALMATLPGVPFYQRQGYRPGRPEALLLDGTSVAFVPMTKILLPSQHSLQEDDSPR